MHEVFAHRVSPVHIAPHRCIGIVLEIEVPFTVFIHQPVGIVHPAIGRRVVIHGAVLVGVGGVESVGSFQVVPAFGSGLGLLFHFHHSLIGRVGAIS